MIENVFGSRPYEERLAAYKQQLIGCSAQVVVELAACAPGSSMDAPFAIIDPALNAAAQQLVEEVGL